MTAWLMQDGIKNHWYDKDTDEPPTGNWITMKEYNGFIIDKTTIPNEYLDEYEDFDLYAFLGQHIIGEKCREWCDDKNKDRRPAWLISSLYENQFLPDYRDSETIWDAYFIIE